MQFKRSTYLKIVTLSSFLFFVKAVFALQTVTCTSTTSLLPGYNTIFYMSSTTNATVALSTSSATYPIIVQCSLNQNTGERYYTSGFDHYESWILLTNATACTMPLFNISSSTARSNLHVEDTTLTNYSPSSKVCLFSLPGLLSSATTTLQSGNCNGFQTTLFSVPPNFSTTGNSHIGDANAYNLKKCLTFVPSQVTTVTLSTTTMGFGQLSSSAVKYATAGSEGSTTEQIGFTLHVSINNNISYVVKLQADTLRNQQNNSYIIAEAGSTGTTTPSAGSDLFGIKIIPSYYYNASFPYLSARDIYGYPQIASPYSSSTYVFVTSTSTAATIINGPSNENDSYRGADYNFYLAASIPGNKPAGNYVTNMTIIVAPTF